MRKKSIGNRLKQSGSSKRLKRVIILFKNGRGMIKEKKIKIKSKKVKSNY